MADWCLLQVRGDCMAPRIRDGAWVRFERGREARAGDVVVARGAAGLVVKELLERNGRRWLVSRRQIVPIALVPPVEIVGVVTLVTQPP